MAVVVKAEELKDVVVITASFKIDQVIAHVASGSSSLVLMNVSDKGELSIDFNWQANKEGVRMDLIEIQSIGDEGDVIEVIEADGTRHTGNSVIPFFRQVLIDEPYWFGEIRDELVARGWSGGAAADTAPVVEPSVTDSPPAPVAQSEKPAPKPAPLAMMPDKTLPIDQGATEQAIHDAAQESLQTMRDIEHIESAHPLHGHMERVVIEPTYDSDVAFVGRKLLECQFSGIHPFTLSIYQTQAGNMVVVESYDQRVEVLRVPKEAVCSKVAAMGLSGADAKSVCRAFVGHKVVEID
jgi:hypothetical protein